MTKRVLKAYTDGSCLNQKYIKGSSIIQEDNDNQINEIFTGKPLVIDISK